MFTMLNKIILIFFLLATPCFATNYCLDANNKGCWLMEYNGNEIDASGNAADLTETSGTITTQADKKFGTFSREFLSADTEYLLMADGGSTDISGKNISISAWVKTTTVSGTKKIVSKMANTGYGNSYYLGIYNNQYQFRFGYGATCASFVTKSSAVGSVVVNTWQHIVAVSNGTDLRMYVNGALSGSAYTFSQNLCPGNLEFVVGVGRQEGSGTTIYQAYWNGKIDDLAVFNRALTEEEITDIYTNGLTGSETTSRRKGVLLD